jgi:hypothetical protein
MYIYLDLGVDGNGTPVWRPARRSAADPLPSPPRPSCNQGPSPLRAPLRDPHCGYLLRQRFCSGPFNLDFEQKKKQNKPAKHHASQFASSQRHCEKSRPNTAYLKTPVPRRTPARDAPVERGIPRRGDGRVGRQALEVLIPGVVARTGPGQSLIDETWVHSLATHRATSRVKSRPSDLDRTAPGTLLSFSMAL